MATVVAKMPANYKSFTFTKLSITQRKQQQKLQTKISNNTQQTKFDKHLHNNRKVSHH